VASPTRDVLPIAEQRAELAEQIAVILNENADLDFFDSPHVDRYTGKEVLKWLNTQVDAELRANGLTNDLEIRAAKDVILTTFLAADETGGVRKTVTVLTTVNGEVKADKHDITLTTLLNPESIIPAIFTVMTNANADAARFPRQFSDERQYTSMIEGLRTSGQIGPQVANSMLNMAAGGDGFNAFDPLSGRFLTPDEQQNFIDIITTNQEEIISAAAGESGSEVSSAVDALVNSPRADAVTGLGPIAETLAGKEVADAKTKAQELTDEFVTGDPDAAFKQALAQAGLPSDPALLQSKEEKDAWKLAKAEFDQAILALGENPSADLVRSVIDVQTDALRDTLAAAQPGAADLAAARDILSNLTPAQVAAEAKILLNGLELEEGDAEILVAQLRDILSQIPGGTQLPSLRDALAGLLNQPDILARAQERAARERRASESTDAGVQGILREQGSLQGLSQPDVDLLTQFGIDRVTSGRQAGGDVDPRDILSGFFVNRQRRLQQLRPSTLPPAPVLGLGQEGAFLPPADLDSEGFISAARSAAGGQSGTFQGFISNADTLATDFETRRRGILEERSRSFAEGSLGDLPAEQRAEVFTAERRAAAETAKAFTFEDFLREREPDIRKSSVRTPTQSGINMFRSDPRA
jgi:hypothetical protein